jgi:hypothetical protein
MKRIEIENEVNGMIDPGNDGFNVVRVIAGYSVQYDAFKVFTVGCGLFATDKAEKLIEWLWARVPATNKELTAEDKKIAARKRAAANRKAREQVMKDCGLIKVRGALGGIYWE